MKTWSMLRRLTMTLMALLGAFWLASTAISTMVLQSEVNEVLDSGLQETGERLLSLIETTTKGQTQLGVLDDSKEVLGNEGDSDEYIVYQVTDKTGRTILHSHGAPSQPWPQSEADRFSTDGDWRIFTAKSKNDRFVLQVGEKISHRYSGLYNAILGLLSSFLLLLLLTAFAIWKIAKAAAKPLSGLSEEITKRSEDNLSPLSLDAVPSELHTLVTSTNHLMAQLRTSIEGERAFASNSAHELRTPVAGAQAQAQVLADELSGRPEGVRAAAIVKALQRLSRLVDKLLQLSRTEAGAAMRREHVNLTELTTFLVAENQRNTPERTFAFHNPSSDPIIVRGDHDMIALAIQNLIDNAINHGRQTGIIEIKVGAGRSVSVTNACDVIPGERLQSLHKRFVRGHSQSEGTGLGLSIVEQIMQQSGGSLQLVSPAPGKIDGLQATLVLP